MRHGLFSRRNIWRLPAFIAAAGVLLQAALQRQADVLRWPEITSEFGPADSDVWLRLTQVRQWLSGGDFFDHAVRNTNAPFGGVSIHWTRPMDMLLGLFYAVMPHGLSVDTRLLLAQAWAPPLLGIAAFFLLAKAAWRRFDNVHVVWVLLFLLATSPLPSYFPPGECDHHGLLALLWCGVLCVLMRPLDVRSGAVAGALLGVMVWISTEGLMLYGATGLVLGVLALRDARQMRPLAALAVAAAVVSMIGLAVEAPSARWFSFIAYDTLSIVYVALLALVAVAALVLSLPAVTRMETGRRFVAMCAAGGVALAAEFLLFPKLVHGPLAGVDPFITQVFFPRVMEAKPLWHHTRDVLVQQLWQPALALALLAAAWRGAGRAAHRRQVVILLALILCTLLMTFAQGRWTYYLQPPALIAAASLLPPLAVAARSRMFRIFRRADRAARPYLSLLAASVAMVAAGVPPAAAGDAGKWNCQAQMRYVIQTQQLQKVLGDKPRILFAPPEVAGDILFFTPYRVIAGEYHREGRGLADLDSIQKAETAEAARKVLAARQADSLLACPVMEDEGSWLHNLTAATHPAWLAPVRGMKGEDLPGPKPVLFSIRAPGKK